MICFIYAIVDFYLLYFLSFILFLFECTFAIRRYFHFLKSKSDKNFIKLFFCLNLLFVLLIAIQKEHIYKI
nr:MAG TPA: hypothetical protein [Siphoviridae sp. ctngg6]